MLSKHTPVILSGKHPAQALLSQTSTRVRGQFGISAEQYYLAIIYIGSSEASAMYIQMKSKKVSSAGLSTYIYGQDPSHDVSVHGVCTYIQSCNHDIYCLGVLVQLPLPSDLMSHTHTIVDTIARHKDVDGLGAEFLGKSYAQGRDVVSATPSAVLGICDWYHIDLHAKRVIIIGQSHLIGKPLAVQCINRGANVISVNHTIDQGYLRQLVYDADVIMSCTGVVHLIDHTRLRDDQTQYIIDIGRGTLDGQAVGDVKCDDALIGKVAGYTPIPGGVGPMTIASLLHNISKLYGHHHSH